MGVETVLPPPASGPPAASQTVPLLSGDRLTRAEFERRYMAHPELKNAELIEGVVYVASPVRFEQHGRPHYTLITWLGVYQAATPGVVGADNATVRLDFENEVQPDALLRLPPERGGRSRVAPDDYLEGPPELIVEVAASSAAYDLHDKRRAYARNGVQEYVALQVYEQRVDWFVLREGVYATLTPDAQGLLCSEVFPGLWLDPAAFWRGDLAALLAVLQRGLATPDHTGFADRLGGVVSE
jgi:Uma2 family endonuclease